MELNKNNPKYVDQWLDNYNQARIKVGLDAITEKDLEKIGIIGTMEV